MRGVLITRPEPGAAETAAAVIALGWTPILAPALSLHPRAIPTMVAQASLITSRSAAAALPPGLPVLAVGEATAAAAPALGHAGVAGGGGGRRAG
ncbi:MAG: uroporphyrinogen-III synthase, partial [Rubritepida sp.]|nr:uroporphyrinogen-III synthase [Rubritepida sp.]